MLIYMRGTETRSQIYKKSSVGNSTGNLVSPDRLFCRPTVFSEMSLLLLHTESSTVRQEGCGGYLERGDSIDPSCICVFYSKLSHQCAWHGMEG